MKTFCYESNGNRYRECYFDMSEYKNGERCLAIYGYADENNNISYISDATIEVSKNLKENQVAIDNETNTNLISFLLDEGIVTGISKREEVNGVQYPVVDLDLKKLNEYSYKKEEFKIAS